MSKKKIKILVGYHEPSTLFKDDVLTPINGGRAILKKKYEAGLVEQDKYEWLVENTIGDDSGDNISFLNPIYNEQSIIYWAWKNLETLDNPDYIGFMHYRRHFVFSGELKPKAGRWTVDFDSIGMTVESYLQTIGYSREKLEQLTGSFPCIVASASCDLSVREQYKESRYHLIEDLQLCEEIIKRKFPSFVTSMSNYLEGKTHYFCNMFILRADLYQQYCEFIFSVLSEFVEMTDMKQRSQYEKRLFISERLTGIFITKLISEGIPCKTLPITFISNTQVTHPIRPSFETDSVNIVFAVDENYLPQLEVALHSLISHISSKRNYDIYILHHGIPDRRQNEFLKPFSRIGNVKIRFVDISAFITSINQDLFYIEIHVSLSTYFRIFIQEIFRNFPKVLYLDSDIIILDDVATLFDFNMQGYPIAAALDIRECLASKLNLTVSNGVNWRQYLKRTLKLDNEYRYFQAGVLLFDLEKMKDFSLQDRCIEALKEIKKPILSDQDILNSVFHNEVCFFPTKWNIEWQILFEFPDYQKQLPEEHYQWYIKALNDPGIVHYASSIKPWNDPRMPLAHYWWRYARLSQGYEMFLMNMVGAKLNNNLTLRQIADVLLPIGTRRRYVVAKFYRLYRKIVRCF